MEQKLIFLDIDGTLCPRGSNQPPDSAVEAIQAARRQGHKIFLSSGRNMASLEHLLDYGFDGVIASAGGHVRLGDRVLFDHPMAPELRDQLLRVTWENHILRVLECQEGCYGVREPEDAAISPTLRAWWKGACDLLQVKPMEEYRGEKAYKMVFAANDMERLEAFQAAAQEEFRFVFQPAGGVLLGELIHRSFHKGQGVRQMCAALGAELSQTICFGDSMNDWEMMEVAGTSVCMGDGDEKLKEICDAVCPPAGEDGLKTAFAQLNLI